MRQQILAGAGFERHRRLTRRERFLQEMDRLVPWQHLGEVVAPYYPTGERGRPPVGLERMLRVYCLGHWYNLSDPALEEALYEIEAMRRFVGIDLGREAAPDETTICKFRHLLAENELGAALFAEINAHLADQGVQLSGGTIVDATIIDAPSSTKNQRGERDPYMHQTRKRKQWYFAMTGHFGVDSATKLIHKVVAAAANTADGSVVGDLLHGQETRVWGDKAYAGHREAIAGAAPEAQNHTHDKGRRHRPLSQAQEAANHYKLRVRSKVEHPIARSRGSLASARCATAVSPSTPTDCSSPARWQICSWSENDCWSPGLVCALCPRGPVAAPRRPWETSHNTPWRP